MGSYYSVIAFQRKERARKFQCENKKIGQFMTSLIIPSQLFVLEKL